MNEAIKQLIQLWFPFAGSWYNEHIIQYISHWWFGAVLDSMYQVVFVIVSEPLGVALWLHIYFILPLAPLYHIFPTAENSAARLDLRPMAPCCVSPLPPCSVLSRVLCPDPFLAHSHPPSACSRPASLSLGFRLACGYQQFAENVTFCRFKAQWVSNHRSY